MIHAFVLVTLANDEIIWFISEVLAFVIIIALIIWWRPGFLGRRTIAQSMNQALERREEQIRDQLSAAERSRQEAERIRAASEQDIARAREEASTIVARASTTGEAILAELQQRSRDEYDRIVGQARVQIDYERQQAEAALQRRAADIVVDAARQVARENLDATADRQIIGTSLADLGDVR